MSKECEEKEIIQQPGEHFLNNDTERRKSSGETHRIKITTRCNRVV
jgi:hypothetical protein